MTISREEARAVAREAVSEVFDRLGVDLTDPESVHSFRKDMLYMRKSRQSAEEVGRIVKKAGITVFITGLAFALYWGLKAAFGQ